MSSHAWLPWALGSTAKERLAWETLTAPDHPQITAFWGQYWASCQADSKRCKNQCFTLYCDLLSCSTQSVWKLPACRWLFTPSNLHTTSFLPSQLQSNPAIVLPSLFQASFVLMRSEVFHVLAIYSHQATGMELSGKLNMSKNKYTRLTAMTEIQQPSTLEGRRQNHFKISLYKYKKCMEYFWD